MKEGNGEAVSFFHFSLIRTVGYAEGTLVRQKKAKTSVFSLFCAHLSVPLHSQLVLPHTRIGWCGDGAKMGMG